MGMEGPNQPPLEKEMDSGEFTVNPETGMLVSDGQEYANTPRMRNFIKRANAIRNSLPTLEEGKVRVWRGNREDEIGKNPSFTNSLEGIALPFLDGYGGKLSYVDVDKTDLDTYVINLATEKDSEFILPPELAVKATAVEEVPITIVRHR